MFVVLQTNSELHAEEFLTITGLEGRLGGESTAPRNLRDFKREVPGLGTRSLGALEGSTFVRADGVLLVGDFDAVELSEGVDGTGGEFLLEGAGDGEVDGGRGTPVGFRGGDLDAFDEGTSTGADAEGGGTGRDEVGESGGDEGDEDDKSEDAHFVVV